MSHWDRRGQAVADGKAGLLTGWRLINIYPSGRVACERLMATRLTRAHRRTNVVKHAVSQANISGVARTQSHDVRVRLCSDHDARPSDAVLRFHALLVAWSRWSRLLQDDAIHARSLRADVVCAWAVLFSCPICVDAAIRRIP